MAQKFISQDEALERLEISKEHLAQLRESGKLRAYRDGVSWKFRTDEIEQMAAEGAPSVDPGASDLSLDLGSESDSSIDPASKSVFELELDEETLSIEEGASDLDLKEPDEPTVAADPEGEAESSDVELSLDIEPSDIADSILLSEAELGESTDHSPSTIIGKAGLEDDLDLVLTDEEEASAGPVSDVKLASPESSVLSDTPGEGVLDIDIDDDSVISAQSPSASFENLEELEIDLEAESSRILAPEDVAKVQQAAAEANLASDSSGLDLAPAESSLEDSSSSVDLGSEAGGDSTGQPSISSLELEDDEDDDLVLGDGSDITLSGESSGINLIAASDSGLVLDDVPLDLAGSSPMGSSLDLGDTIEKGSDIDTLEVEEDLSASDVGEDFQLTPLGKEEEFEEEDSSQIIALDDMVEEESADALLGVGEEDAGILSEDFGMDVGLSGEVMAGGALASVGPVSETPFSVPIIVSLGFCIFMLSLCGMMAYDMLRNIWSWDGVTSINSSLLEVINPFL